MEVIILDSDRQVAEMAAAILVKQVQQKPDSVLGLATGSTMVEVYAGLCRAQLDFSGVRTFNLDEYVGLAPTHPSSYHSFMREHLFEKVNLKPENCRVPDGLAGDIPGHCAAYEQAIEAAGGIDIQLLGIGEDGHIAFNEPGSSLASRTRIKVLTPITRASNARHFPPGEEVPLHVLTMGVGTILEARRCLLLAWGEKKAAAIQAMVEGPVTAMCPSSALQLHPVVTVILDRLAADRLSLKAYFRRVYETKPDWQREV
ncbi:MAG: glucosamine-6-phosphate deaminase [Vulcanimicrobiota bacterium]